MLQKCPYKIQITEPCVVHAMARVGWGLPRAPRALLTTRWAVKLHMSCADIFPWF